MLAEYRARGGRIEQREAGDPFSTSSPQSRAVDAALRPPLKSDTDEDKSSRHTDVNWASKVEADFSFIRVLFLSKSTNDEVPSNSLHILKY